MSCFKHIDIHESKKLIDEGNVVIVDIRDPQAFAQGHIGGAIFLNDQNVEEFLKTTDKSKTLLCYCYHGNSSQSAAHYFSHQGFKETYSIKGGFEEWKGTYPSVSAKT